jgi:hypothetical protein
MRSSPDRRVRPSRDSGRLSAASLSANRRFLHRRLTHTTAHCDTLSADYAFFHHFRPALDSATNSGRKEHNSEQLSIMSVATPCGCSDVSANPCGVRLRLSREWLTAVEDHADVLERTHTQFPLLTLYERGCALKEIERLRTCVENAQTALDAHIAEHGC